MTKDEILTLLISESLARGLKPQALALILNRPPRTIYGWFQRRAAPTRKYAELWAQHLSITLPKTNFVHEYRNRGCTSAIPLVHQLFAEADRLGYSNGELSRRAHVEPATIAFLRIGRGYPQFSTLEAVADALNFKIVLEPK